jgi:hypothetical protein
MQPDEASAVYEGLIKVLTSRERSRFFLADSGQLRRFRQTAAWASRRSRGALSSRGRTPQGQRKPLPRYQHNCAAAGPAALCNAECAGR